LGGDRHLWRDDHHFGVIFNDNQAAYGGAINNADGDWYAANGDTTVTGTVDVTGSTFTGNIATAGGGGAIDNGAVAATRSSL